MRLVCPRCGAQYEIDAEAIPARGRDVEGSTLAQAVRWHAQHRVLADGRRTVVFS